MARRRRKAADVRWERGIASQAHHTGTPHRHTTQAHRVQAGADRAMAVPAKDAPIAIIRCRRLLRNLIAGTRHNAMAAGGRRRLELTGVCFTSVSLAPVVHSPHAWQCKRSARLSPVASRLSPVACLVSETRRSPCLLTFESPFLCHCAEGRQVLQ